MCSVKKVMSVLDKESSMWRVGLVADVGVDDIFFLQCNRKICMVFYAL